MTQLCASNNHDDALFQDMADTINASDITDFLTNTACIVHSTYHTVLKTSSGVAIFGRDMLFDIPFLADWSKIGEYR
jgi:hypothetical protein